MPSFHSFQAFAVQARWTLRDYVDVPSYTGFIERLMAEVERQRTGGLPCLAAFPECIGLPLLFLDEGPKLAECISWRQGVEALARIESEAVEGYSRQ